MRAFPVTLRNGQGAVTVRVQNDRARRRSRGAQAHASGHIPNPGMHLTISSIRSCVTTASGSGSCLVLICFAL
jgi:hypothetical protein